MFTRNWYLLHYCTVHPRIFSNWSFRPFGFWL